MKILLSVLLVLSLTLSRADEILQNPTLENNAAGWLIDALGGSNFSPRFEASPDGLVVNLDPLNYTYISQPFNDPGTTFDGTVVYRLNSNYKPTKTVNLASRTLFSKFIYPAINGPSPQLVFDEWTVVLQLEDYTTSQRTILAQRSEKGDFKTSEFSLYFDKPGRKSFYLVLPPGTGSVVFQKISVRRFVPPSPLPDAAPVADTSAPSGISDTAMAAAQASNIIANPEFKNGGASWKIEPSRSASDRFDMNSLSEKSQDGEMVIELKEKKYTVISQRFNSRDANLTLFITYKLSPDYNFAPPMATSFVPSSNSRMDKSSLSSLTNFPLGDSPPSYLGWTIIVVDPSQNAYASTGLLPQGMPNKPLSKGESHTSRISLAGLKEHQEKVFFLILPPGKGSATLQKIYVVPTPPPPSSDTAKPSAPAADGLQNDLNQTK